MYYFIINPYSQSGNGYRLWKKIRRELETRQNSQTYIENLTEISVSRTFSAAHRQKPLNYRYVYTRYPSQMTSIVKRLTSAPKPKHLIIVGGDGSFNEAVNGLCHPEIHRLSFLPAGSGNDLGRSLDFSEDISELLDEIFDGELVDGPLDLGKMKNLKPDSGKIISSSKRNQLRNNRLFSVSCGVGFDAAICEELNRSDIKKWLNRLHLGKAAYPFIGLKQLLLWKPQKALLWIDDQKEPLSLPRFLFLSAHIHPYEGGGFPFCPNADYQDGKLDLCIVHDMTKRQAVPLIPKAKKGLHLGEPGILSCRCEKVKIQLESPLPVHTDGEIPCHSSFLEISTNSYGYYI